MCCSACCSLLLLRLHLSCLGRQRLKNVGDTPPLPMERDGGIQWDGMDDVM